MKSCHDVNISPKHDIDQNIESPLAKVLLIVQYLRKVHAVTVPERASVVRGAGFKPVADLRRSGSIPPFGRLYWSDDFTGNIGKIIYFFIIL